MYGVYYLLLPLWLRQHGKCHYCGGFTIPVRFIKEIDGAVATSKRRMVYLWGKWYGAASVEHLTPQCEGGKNNLKNCVMACVPCNEKRGRAVCRKHHTKKNVPAGKSGHLVPGAGTATR